MSNNFCVIVGLGKTGLSCVRYCLRKGFPFAVTDSRINPLCEKEFKEIAPSAKFVFGKFSHELINKASLLIISPGVSLKNPIIHEAICNGVPYVGDIELFVREIKSPIIAVTGANAKSTVVTLVGEMAKKASLKVKVCGNIGIPVLDVLTEDKADLYVLELSSFQLETTHSLKAKAATILNISEDHMDRYANIDEYICAKQRIYNGCEVAVVNRGDILTKPCGLNSNIKIISFGLNKPDDENYGLIELQNKTYLAKGNQCLLDVNEIKMLGKHNVENSLASLALGDAANIKMQYMLETLKEFSGLPHRCQVVRTLDGVTWYNDSKGTNVGATEAALEGLGPVTKGKIILIAGGDGKGADFNALRDSVQKYVRKIVLIGKDAKKIYDILHDLCEIEFAKSLEEAVSISKQSSNKNDVVLLSPACSSLDMFENYEHRGNEFVKFVNVL